MSLRRTAPLLVAHVLVFAATAHAGQLASNPISHGSGFSSVVCHIANAGKKPIVLESFFIEPIVTTVSHANDYSGCLGSPPYTIQPGQGCTRRMTNPNICNQLDACYCYAGVKGSTKRSLSMTMRQSTSEFSEQGQRRSRRRLGAVGVV